MTRNHLESIFANLQFEFYNHLDNNFEVIWKKAHQWNNLWNWSIVESLRQSYSFQLISLI